MERDRVVISGAGPTGLTTALLLAKYGVPSVVLERGVSLPQHPKAHCINQRTMEVFRGVSGDVSGGKDEGEDEGVSDLASRVKTAMPPIEQWRSFVYCSGSLLDGGGERGERGGRREHGGTRTEFSASASSLLGVVDHFKREGNKLGRERKGGEREGNLDPFRFSPEPVAHLPQHRLVPMLAAMCDRSALVDLRMGREVTGFEQTRDGVCVFHRGLDTSAEETVDETTRGAYLVAADGAHSMVRTSLGIEMDGAGTLQHLINIHFTAPTLAARLVECDRMGMLYFVFGRSHVVVLVAHDLGRGEFVAQVPFFPPLQGAHSFGVDACRDIIRDIAGGDDEGAGSVMRDVVIHDTKPWAMAAAVATRYRADRVFLAGDAAHVVPPAGAFGMNTGVQDAHNLAWKLAVALKKRGDRDGGNNGIDGLLDSYDVERRPVAIANMNLSVDNFHEALAVARVIGLDFDTAQTVNSLLSSGPLASLAPASVRRQLLGAAMTSGLWMGRTLAKAKQKQRELNELFESGRTLRLQYPKEDIGFAYHGPGSFLDVEPEMEDAVRRAVAPKPRDAPYIEDAGSFVPGKRFPHMPMRLPDGDWNGGGESRDRRSSISISSIDIPASVGTNFVLFCSEAKYDAWQTVLKRPDGGLRYENAVSGLGITVVTIEVGSAGGNTDDGKDMHKDSTGDKDTNSSPPAIIRAVIDVDNENARPAAGLWSSLMAQRPDSGVLVRPDGHIYWVGDPTRLQRALDTLEKAVA